MVLNWCQFGLPGDREHCLGTFLSFAAKEPGGTPGVVEARYAAKHFAGTGQLCAARGDLAPHGGSVEGETLP